jgi:hypothetical protein
MKVKTCIRLVILSFLLATATGWGFGENEENNNFWSRLHVSNSSIGSKQGVKQPGSFQITIPDKGKKIIEMGIGLKVDVLSTGLMDLGVFAEYNRNTISEKEQNVIRTGMIMEWQLLDLVRVPHTPILLTNLNYKNDMIKNTRFLQASIAYTHLFRGRGGKSGFPLPHEFGQKIFKFLELTYSPYLGIEYENIISANDEGKKGDILRGFFQVESVLTPTSDKLKEKLELTFGYTYRRDLKNSMDKENKTYQLLKAGIHYYFFKSGKSLLGIGLTYVNGEDPNTGQPKQKYLTLGLKFKLN